MILAFAHPAIVVDNLERAREFYEKMFGFKVIGNEGWSNNPSLDRAIGSKDSACRGYMMAGHNCCLELFEFQAPPQTAHAPAESGPHEQGIRHLSFYVDDCQQEYQRLLALGGSALGEPVDLGGGVHAVYARDPFGNIIELCEIASPDEHPTRLPGIDSLSNFVGPTE
jgi:catechol 2,3-dioxygenase-like lactoylglutathione lyase family enzyme